MLVTLRAWLREDAPQLAQLLNNPKIHANLRDGLPVPYTEKDALEFIEKALSAPAASRYSWAILADGEVAGSVGIFRLENVHRLTAEIGYYIGEPYWGRGIATAAVKEACRIAFEATDLVRIFAEPYSRNEASRRVLEKADFRREGTMRKNAVKNGEIIDMEMYALIR